MKGISKYASKHICRYLITLKKCSGNDHNSTANVWRSDKESIHVNVIRFHVHIIVTRRFGFNKKKKDKSWRENVW